MNLSPSFQFIFDIKSNIRIRYVEIHMVQPYLLILTNNYSLQIWDYQKKTCLKSLNIQTIEPDRIQEVKQLHFHDSQTIFKMFNDSHSIIAANVMILTSDKLYSYKYHTDTTDIVTNAAIGTQNRCFEFIDAQYIAVGGEGVKIIDLKCNQVVKVMKGYHQKPITQLISYKQNQFDRSRLVASSLDGTLACWNADTALESPAFKFLMQKKGKQLITANDGQEILSISYDCYDYQIVTVTEDYITVWSSLNGMEVSRYKQLIGIKEIAYINHGQLPQSSFIGHARNSELFYLHLPGKQSKQYDYNLLMDLKNCQDIDKTIKIIAMTTNRIKTNIIGIATTHGLYIVSLSNTISRIEFNYTFTCSMTIKESKEFVDDTGITKKMTNLMFEKVKAYEQIHKQDQQQNMMYLTTSGKYLVCNLIEFVSEFTNQKEEWTAMTRQCKQYTFTTSFNWDDSAIMTSLSGRYVAVRNANGYYVVLAINNRNLNRDMMESEMRETLYFIISEFDQIQNGMSISISWHHVSEQLAVVVPLNDKNVPLQIEEKLETQTTGFFKQKTVTRSSFHYDSNWVNSIINIYGFDHTKKNQIYLKYSVNTIPKPQLVFGLQDQYFITSLTEFNVDAKLKNDIKSFRLPSGQFYNITNQTLEPVGTQYIAPKMVKCNINGNLAVFVYEYQFSLFKKNNEQFTLIKTFNHSINDCFFWEDLLFYVTDEQIELLMIINENPLTIHIASSDPPRSQKQCCEFLTVNKLDSYYPDVLLRPAGQLKILMIYDSKLIIVNQAGEVHFLSLSHPLIEVCMLMQVDEFQKCVDVANLMDKQMHSLIVDMLIQKNAYEFVQYLNMDLHEKILLDLQHSPDSVQINIEQLDAIMMAVPMKNKEDYLSDLVIAFAELRRDEDVQLIIEYAMQNQLLSSNIIPLLSIQHKKLYLQQQGIFSGSYDQIPSNNQEFELMLQNMYNILQL